MERDKMVEALAERLRFLCCTHVQMLDAREIRPFAQSAGRNGWLKVAGIVADEAGKAHVDEVAALQSRLAAAEAEAARASGLLQRWFDDDESYEAYRALVDETLAHLASRPEGEARNG